MLLQGKDARSDVAYERHPQSSPLIPPHTRDRLYGHGKLGPKGFLAVDTGGLEGHGLAEDARTESKAEAMGGWSPVLRTRTLSTVSSLTRLFFLYFFIENS